MRISDWSSDVCSSDLPIPDIHHIDPPFWFADGGDLTPEDYGLLAARRLEARILELGPERVAAFIGEPIMGAIGVYIPPMRSEEHTSELQSLMRISYAVFCLKKKTTKLTN